MNRQIQQILERNKRVELDKAWEISITRRAIVAAITYLVVSIFLIVIGVPRPWLNALVPTAGFILSTITMPFFKRLWAKKIYKRK
jgi:hypothetical protein